MGVQKFHLCMQSSAVLPAHLSPVDWHRCGNLPNPARHMCHVLVPASLQGVGVGLFRDRACAVEACNKLSGAQADGRRLELVLMNPDNHVSFSCTQVNSSSKLYNARHLLQHFWPMVGTFLPVAGQPPLSLVDATSTFVFLLQSAVLGVSLESPAIYTLVCVLLEGADDLC